MKIGVTLPHMGPQVTRENIIKGIDVVGDMVAGAASHYCFDHTPFGGIVIPTLCRAVSRTPKGAVLWGPIGVLLQMSDTKLTPNAPKEKNNDR